tara:strand:+ start:37152 stop:38609 length:1458 start_codon:yes stop_codon:yes gene_type:complete
MSIQIYNTQSRSKEEFVPVHKGEVRMYVCGPTVYDFLHIGNYRGAIFFNLVRNWFEKSGYSVKYVYNYTDVDDKIINRANDEGVTAEDISKKYIAEFEKDYSYLKLRPHTANPKVSEHMEDIIEIIEGLIENNKAYAVDGDVYYAVQSFEEYGKLSNKKIDEMQEGHRIEVDSRKKHPADFALWKKAKDGEPSWKSPWSDGRPGWHIECSAMSRALLGDTLDIHGGGLDLVFPHHENEIAQSEGCTGHQYVKYWMHNNMLEFGNQKMSKSLGNVRTGRSFLEQYNGEILKYMMLSAHYRSTIDFSEDPVNRAIQALARFYSALALAKTNMDKGGALAPVPEKFQKLLDEQSDKIKDALDDDFGTPEVFAALFEVVREFNKQVRRPGKPNDAMIATSEVFYHWIISQGEVMALFSEPAAEFLKALDDMLLDQKSLKREEIDKLVAQRAQARADKDFAASDEIRDQLIDLGIAVMDAADGSTWEVAK